jgi:hypothetical protein
MRDDEGEAEFPRQLAGSTEQPDQIFERVPGWHANSTRADGELQLTEGEPPAGTWPVYRRPDDGELVAATGRIFVRLAEGQRAADHGDAFRSAGYEIDRALPWAPNAAWLRATDWGVAAALSRLSQLAAVPGVSNVEPELLRRRSRK